jgi:hypothetical protein
MSKGDPGTPPESVIITGVGDTVGAAILTFAVLVCLISWLFWIGSDLTEKGTMEKPLWDYLLALMISYLILEYALIKGHHLFKNESHAFICLQEIF